MSMPLSINKLEYIRVLRAGGVAQEAAELHADALEAAISQPIVLPGDLAILKAEILARMDERLLELEQRILAKLEAKLDAKLKPINLMLMLSLILHAVTLTKLLL